MRNTHRPLTSTPTALRRATHAVVETLEGRQLLSSVPVSYEVPSTGKVSLGVYDTGGKLVRTLLSAAERTAGAHTEMWDGLDDHGKPLPSGTGYTYKLLQLTAPLKAEFLMTPGDSYPKDQNNYYGAAPGNHIAAMAVAVDSTGIYIGAGGKESVGQDLKLSPDGNTRLWTNSAMPSTTWTTPDQNWHGIRAIDTAGDTAYYLYSNHAIGTRTISTNQTSPYKTTSSSAVGDIDVRYFAEGTTTRVNGPSSYEGAVNIDFAVRQVGTTTVMVVSYTDKNEVFFWDPTTGNLLARHKNITAPTGVAIDDQGRALVATGNKIVRLTRSGSTVTSQTVVGANGTTPSPLVQPYRLDTSGASDILVVDRGTSQQVKRFNLSGITSSTSPPVTSGTAYGDAGGRKDGLYVKRNFLNVTDIAATADGGFIVAEPYAAPVRVAKFTAAGAWEREWTGGTEWVRGATFEPGNPNVMWGETAAGTITRYALNPVSRTWSVHSNYTFDANFNAAPAFLYWHAVTRSGVTYLFRSESPEVLRVKVTGAGTTSEKWELLKAAYLDPTSNGPSNYNATTGKYDNHASPASVWTDGDGDGMRDAGETKYYKTNWSGSSFWASRNDESGNYYGIDTSNRKVNMVPIVSWGAYGPTYDLGTEISWNPADTSKANDDYYNGLTANPVGQRFSEDMVYAGKAYSGDTARVGQRVNQKDSYPLYRQNGTSPLYAALTFGQEGSDGWGSGRVSRVGKWDAAGNLLWEAGQAPLNDNYYDRYHTVQPGEIWSDFRAIVGPVADANAGGGESIVVNDYDGGYSGTGVAKTYVWDRDGLYVGGLFDSIDLTGGRVTRDYATGTEVAGTDIVRDPATGDVYYVADRENHIRMYKITGWNNWHRDAGAVPALAAEPLARTTGLQATYYDSNEFSDAKVIRTDLSPNFNAASATAGASAAPAGSGISTADNYTIQWLGDLTAPQTGSYTFSLRVHGGARLYLNGTSVAGSFNERASESTFTGTYTMTAGQTYTLRLDFLQNMDRDSSPAGTEKTALDLTWKLPGATAFSAIPTGAGNPFSHTSAGEGVGLTARYFDNKNFTSPTATRVDANVNLAAASGSTPTGTGLTTADHYSVRWTGQVTVPVAGRYKFTFDGDDGARLWVNGRQILERWTNGTGATTSQAIYLAPEKKYDIRLDYYQAGGAAAAKLLWTRPDATTAELVPARFLSPSGDVPPKVSFAQGPGIIQAEDYDEGGEGVAFHDTGSSSNHGYRGYDGVDFETVYTPSALDKALVNYEVQARKTEWLTYSFNITDAGAYQVKTLIRSGYSGNWMKYYIDGETTGTQLTVPDSDWAGVFLTTAARTLPAGLHTIRLEFGGTGADPVANVDYLEVVGGPSGLPQPYGGTAQPVTTSGPSRIEAELYDRGGQSVGYSDTTVANVGTARFRPDESVDVQTVNDGGSTQMAVGHVADGEWLGYTVDVLSADTYDLRLRAANGNGTAATVRVWSGSTDLTGAVSIASSTWSDWKDVLIPNVTLAAGQQTLRLEFLTGKADVNWLQFVPAAPTQGAYGNNGLPWSITTSATTRIQAEDYDTGGEGVAYHDNEATNKGGAYRTDEGVDVASTGDGGTGYVVNNFGAGEWVEYTVNVSTTGTYGVRFRAATGNAGGATLRVLVDEAPLPGTDVAIANAGWTTFRDYAKAEQFTLTAGKHVIRVLNVSGWLDLNWVEIGPSVARTGTIIGTTGSYNDAGNTIHKAFDGDPTTYFDPPTGTLGNQWAGLDMGSARTITQVRFAPRSGWANRMVGGSFQISDSADFSSGVTTIYTITSAPAEDILTTANVPTLATGRYVRYLAPADQWGNVAELEFVGW